MVDAGGPVSSFGAAYAGPSPVPTFGAAYAGPSPVPSFGAAYAGPSPVPSFGAAYAGPSPVPSFGANSPVSSFGAACAASPYPIPTRGANSPVPASCTVPHVVSVPTSDPVSGLGSMPACIIHYILHIFHNLLGRCAFFTPYSSQLADASTMFHVSNSSGWALRIFYFLFISTC